ncbi:hypothetical protein Fcan01_28395 [Folsomia candida]|uniref:Uncharacterized protein n=1 Tax=Folsomia candida TaxID=158441 RepID=A0A226CVQ4_FOLCA|nr:hypothetical protein Fcan01_28395 [Folsomia candida]
MPPVTARDSVKGAFYAPRPWLQTYKTTFAITLKESEKTPKYRNYMKRENLNLVCPAKCHPLQLETPERARCTPLGVKINLKIPAKCHPLQLETPERARFTPLGHSYKSETKHFCDNFKGIRENSEIPKLHEKGKPKSCMSCQMPPVTVRDSGKGALYAPRNPRKLRNKENTKMENLNLVCPAKCHPLQLETRERARFTPLGHSYKSETSTFAITLKESEKTPKYRNYMKRENLNLVCPAKCHPLQLETPERARCTPLGVDLKVYNQL